MSSRRIPMMTEDEIQAELGWIRPMIYSHLDAADSDTACRLYRRERVLAVAQSPEGQAAQRRWNATLRGSTPNLGWTPRLGDIGRPLGITAVAAGRILDLMGYRSDGCITDSAMEAGFGVPRWNGFTMQNDWHLDRVLAAIRTAVQDTENPAIANALVAAIGRQQGRKRSVERKRRQDEEEAACRQEEEAVLSALGGELRELRDTDPGMSLLNAVEFITPDLGRRIVLYRYCGGDDHSFEPNGTGQDGLLRTSSLVDKDLALLERRAKAEGFRI
jgi:hypothetical protein